MNWHCVAKVQFHVPLAVFNLIMASHRLRTLAIAANNNEVNSHISQVEMSTSGGQRGASCSRWQTT